MTLARKGDAVLRDFLQQARRGAHRTVVLLDLDGTLERVVRVDAKGKVERELHATLELLARRMQLWFVSSRDADTLRRATGIGTAGYLGADGLDVLEPGGLRPMLPMADVRRELSRMAQDVSADVPEIVPHLERRRWGAVIRLDAFPPESEVRMRLRKSLEARLTGIARVVERRGTVEIAPAVEQDKGTALRWLLDTARPRFALAAGDDISALPMFRALSEARERRLHGVSIAIEREDAAEVVEVADASVEGVAGLHAVLQHLLKAG